MIVSDFESICIRLLLGAALDCNTRGRYDEIKPFIEGILDWCSNPGVTEAARLEIDGGGAISNP